jgi:protein tyrosine/serine phosphatase
MEDYLASDRHFGADRLAAVMADVADLPAERLTPTSGAIQAMVSRPEYLDAALDSIDAEHGGLDRYLDRHGLDGGRRAHLRELLTA